MSKGTMALQLPMPVKKNIETVGEQIKLARKRRKLSIAAIAERAQCSELTVIRAEKGEPTVAFGIYARILYALGLHDDILHIAKTDEAGNALVNARILNKKTDIIEDVFS